MNFPYAIFEVTVSSIVVYLISVSYLFYLVKKLFPDFWIKSYPYGLMMTKAGHVPLLSARYFQVGFATFRGHFQMMKFLLTSKYSENDRIRTVKNITRLLLVCALASLIYLVFTLSTTIQ